MAKRKQNALISLIMNSLLIVLEIIVIICSFTVSNYAGEVMGFKSFRFFTIDSNTLCGIAAVFLVINDIFILQGKRDALPKYVSVFKFVVTVMITITFLTVICWLAPVQGFGRMYGGISCVTHLIAPLLTMTSFFIFEYEKSETNLFLESLFGLVPIFIYGTVYLVMVVAIGQDNGGWEDFYNFNTGGFWYIALIIMLIASYAFSLGVMALHRFVGKKLSTNKQD